MPRYKIAGASPDLANTPDSEGLSIYDEATLGLPKPGPYRVRVKQLEATLSGAGNPQLKMVCEIAEKPGTARAKYNNYGMWTYVPLSPEQADRANAFLTAVAGGDARKAKAAKAALWGEKMVVDDTDKVTAIGPIKVTGEGLVVGVNTTREAAKDGYDAKTRVVSFFPEDKIPAGAKVSPVEETDDDADADDDVDTDEELDDDADLDSDDDDFADEDETDDGDDDDAESAYLAELEALSGAALKKLIKDEYPEITAKDMRGLDKNGAIDLVMSVAFPADEEPEEEPEPEPEPAKARRPGRPAASSSRPAARRPARGGKEPPF